MKQLTNQPANNLINQRKIAMNEQAVNHSASETSQARSNKEPNRWPTHKQGASQQTSQPRNH